MTSSTRLGILLLAGLVVVPPPEPTPVTVPVSVRVRLFAIEQPREIRITTGEGQTTVMTSGKDGYFRSVGPVTISRPGGASQRLEYPLEVTAGKTSLLIVNDLPFEEYVAAVLAGESSNFKSDESLKAVAVAARTYATHFLHQHQAEGFNFCDTTHCQDFRVTAVTDRLRKAVNDTRGKILTYDDQPIAAYYHQDCGGITEGRAAYLPQLRDRFCIARGPMTWKAELTAKDVSQTFDITSPSAVEVLTRTNSGRAAQLRIRGEKDRIVSAESFRLTIGRKLGWDKIKSDLYDIRPSGGGFLFEGRGAGHGIGLCQDGAAAMGEQGSSYREILAYYYPHTHLTSVTMK